MDIFKIHTWRQGDFCYFHEILRFFNSVNNQILTFSSHIWLLCDNRPLVRWEICFLGLFFSWTFFEGKILNFSCSFVKIKSVCWVSITVKSVWPFSKTKNDKKIILDDIFYFFKYTYLQTKRFVFCLKRLMKRSSSESTI